MKPNRPVVPWWLEAGPESCEFCLATYHVEVGYECIECDRPVCPICIVWVREESAIFCPECAPREGRRED